MVDPVHDEAFGLWVQDCRIALYWSQLEASLAARVHPTLLRAVEDGAWCPEGEAARLVERVVQPALESGAINYGGNETECQK